MNVTDTTTRKADTDAASDDDSALLRRAHRLFDSDINADQHNRYQAKEDLLFKAGEMWNPLEEQKRLRNGQPVVRINQCDKFVNQVTGDVRRNVPTITVKPDGFGADEDKARIINGIVRHIQRSAASTEPFINALDNAASCSIGHFRIITYYPPENPFDQELGLLPIMDPLSVVWDQDARLPDRSDAKRCWVLSGMSRDAFKETYPDAVGDGWNTAEPTPNVGYWRMGGRDTVMIAEFFEIVTEETTFVKLDNGNVLDLGRLSPMLQHREASGPVAEHVMDRVGNVYPVAASRKAKAPRCKWYRITSSEVLERGEWVTGHIPIIPVVGPEVHFDDEVRRHSLIRWAKEPMALYNYHRSVQTEMIANMPKAPYLVPIEGIDGLEGRWSDLNKANKPYLPYKSLRDDGVPIPAPTRQSPPVTPPGLNQEIMLAQEDTKNTTGIFDAALGARSNETSGVAIAKRKEESDVGTSIYGARLAGALKRCGTILIAAIPLIYDTARAMKIVHEDDTDETVEINQIVPDGAFYKIHNDITQGRYDLVVDIGPSYASQQDRALELIQSIMADNPQAKMALLDLLIDMAGVPQSAKMVKRIRKLMPPGMVEGDDADNEEISPALAEQQKMAQMMQQLDARLKQAEATEKEARATKAQAEADTAAAETLLKKAEAAERAGAIPPGAAQILLQLMAFPPQTSQSSQPGFPAGQMQTANGVPHPAG